MGILEMFGHFLKTVLMWDHETWFTGILRILSGVREKLPLWAKFWALFGPNRSKIGKFVVYFLEKFPLDSLETWFICLLELLLYVYKR